MRIYIIRHGDPDYEHDSLTPLGWRQAEALGAYLEGLPLKWLYASPYGRAQDTARPAARRLGLEVELLPWVREMTDVTVPSEIRDDLAVWNIPPWQLERMDRGAGTWQENAAFRGTPLRSRMAEMSGGLEALLNIHGIQKTPEGWRFQEAPGPEGDLAIFCHQGAGLTLLACLLGICPIDMWRAAYISPSSVTTVLAEETGDGRCNFRMLGMGEVSHLLLKGVPPCPAGLLYNER